MVWGVCHTSARKEYTYAVAKGICESAGARLCTFSEIKLEAARGTGCGIDSKRVWTSTACSRDRHFTALGDGRDVYGQNKTADMCTKSSSRVLAVRCCADSSALASDPTLTVALTTLASNPTPTVALTTADAPRRVISAESCASLGWPFKNGNVDVCAASKINGKCHKALSNTYAGAESICASTGARLCTVPEIKHQATLGTGCATDFRQIWTATECARGKHFVAFGDGRDVDKRGRPGERCLRDTRAAFAVRCCADAEPAPLDRVFPGSDAGLAVTTAAPPPLKLSSKRCASLQWDFKYGNTDVCAASIVGGRCHKAKNNTHADAKSICAAAGARLCTVPEVKRQATRGTGCAIDFRQIWTATECTPGKHWVAFGDGRDTDKLGRLGERCLRDTQAAFSVRCCADATIPTATTTATTTAATTAAAATTNIGTASEMCEGCFMGTSGPCMHQATQLCFPYPSIFTTEKKCPWPTLKCAGGSTGTAAPMVMVAPGVMAQPDGDGDDNDAATAKAMVVSTAPVDGPSYCTFERGIAYRGNDVKNGQVPASSAGACCTLCRQHSVCTHFTYRSGRCMLKTSDSGRSSGNSNSISGVCAPSLHAATTAAAPHTTATAATTVATVAPWSKCLHHGYVRVGGVCSFSRIDGVCHNQNNLAFVSSEKKCRRAGGRLCAAGEIQSRLGRGSGCELNDDPVWTSTACNGGAGHLVVLGGGPNKEELAVGAKALEVCADDGSAQASLRCCLDDAVASRSLKTCAGLPAKNTWAPVPAAAAPAYCTKDESRCGATHSSKPFPAAMKHCDALGARLCGIHELRQIGQVCPAGADSDGQGPAGASLQVWSNTRCRGGFNTLAHVGNRTIVACATTNQTDTGRVRCCADV